MGYEIGWGVQSIGDGVGCEGSRLDTESWLPAGGLGSFPANLVARTNYLFDSRPCFVPKQAHRL